LSRADLSGTIPQIPLEAAMVTVLRPLSTSELLDRTFHLYKNNFLVFLGIAAIPQLFVLALRLWYAMTLTGPINSFNRFNGTGVLISIASYVAIEISAAATVIAVSNIHLDRSIGVGSAFGGAKSSMVRVLLITLAVSIAAGIGLIFLIVPGVYLWLMWSLAIPATVLEGGGLNVSTTRSKYLTQGSRGRVFVICLLIILLVWIVSVICELPLGMLIGIVFRSHLSSHAMPLIVTASAVGTFLSTSLVGPLLTIALTLIYYDQRVRKEGFDLQLMMASLQPGSQPPAAAAAATTN
jgi:hypothetical protein